MKPIIFTIESKPTTILFDGRELQVQLKEQRKAWMVYDIVRSQYRSTIADQVA